MQEIRNTKYFTPHIKYGSGTSSVIFLWQEKIKGGNDYIYIGNREKRKMGTSNQSQRAISTERPPKKLSLHEASTTHRHLDAKVLFVRSFSPLICSQDAASRRPPGRSSAGGAEPSFPKGPASGSCHGPIPGQQQCCHFSGASSSSLFLGALILESENRYGPSSGPSPATRSRSWW
ncbi:unnamed protein product [Musa hybrid cultivar]